MKRTELGLLDARRVLQPRSSRCEVAGFSRSLCLLDDVLNVLQFRHGTRGSHSK
jgi:hypothetical protein